MERVAHQTIVMQYILELGRQLDRDPRSCVPGFFERWGSTHTHTHTHSVAVLLCRLRSADKVYTDAFEDELSSFIGRVKARARARLEEATRQAEEVYSGRWVGPASEAAPPCRNSSSSGWGRAVWTRWRSWRHCQT